MKSSVFWDIMPCSPVSQPTFRRNISLPPSGSKSKSRCCAFFRRVSCLAYSSTLKMEAMFSSETLVDFHRTERRHVSENSTIHCNEPSGFMKGSYVTISFLRRALLHGF
jgi:hypothetical protein